MKTVIPFLAVLVSVLTPQITEAQTTRSQTTASSWRAERAALSASIQARNAWIVSLLNGNALDTTRIGFNEAVQALIQDLARQGKTLEAQELSERWGRDGGAAQFEMAFSFGFDDLGDHAPLFTWLEAYIVKLEDKFGAIISRLPVVQNIRMMNFAIPVVFAPASSRWQIAHQDNRIEYRKHFIPFANLITYYVANYACNLVVVKSGNTQLKRICKPAAEKLQFAMGRYVAPHISDFIFKVANRKATQRPSFGREHLRYETSEDLAREF